VPRNRQNVDRGEKVRDIVAAAERSVRAGGYEALSFNDIAVELGLRRGAVYWYFKTKDDLFAAAAGSAIRAALSGGPTRAGYLKRITWAVDRLSELQPIHTALQERARHSPQPAALLATFQEEMRSRLREALAGHVPPERLEISARVIVTFVQGLLSEPRTKRARDNELAYLLERIVQQ
jgi:AcrR family transcriptional regulator